MPDEQGNGSRYVTHQRLTDLLCERDTVQREALRELGANIAQSLTYYARSDRVERMAKDLDSLTLAVDKIDMLIDQMRGAASVMRFVFSTSLITLLVALVGLWRALG